MKINFEQLKKQPVDTNILLSLLEMLYVELKQEKMTNIRFNEYCTAEIIDGNTFEISLSEAPISINDILIVSMDGNHFITPSFIEEINGKKVRFTSRNITSHEVLYVTYKY